MTVVTNRKACSNSLHGSSSNLLYVGQLYVQRGHSNTLQVLDRTLGEACSSGLEIAKKE